VKDITTNPNGGFLYAEILNQINISNSSFSNCSSSDSGSFFYISLQNLIEIINIIFYYSGTYNSVDSMYLGMEHLITLAGNTWVFNNSWGNNRYFLYSNSTNNLTLDNENIGFFNSLPGFQIDLWILVSMSSFIMRNFNVSIDLCRHYAILNDNSSISIKSLIINDFQSQSNELFLIEDSSLEFFNMFFSKNLLENLITLNNSMAIFNKVYYLTNMNGSLFMISEQSGIKIINSYFKNENQSASCQIFILLTSNISFIKSSILGFSSISSGGLGNLSNSNISIKKSLILGNKALINGGCFYMYLDFNEGNITYLIVIASSVIANNKAWNYGGVLFSNQSINTNNSINFNSK